MQSPALIVLLGFSGSGKSTLGTRLLERRPSACLLDADLIAVPGVANGYRVRSERDRYSIYAVMMKQAREALTARHDVLWIQALTMEAAHHSHPPPAGRIGLVGLALEQRAALAMIHLDPPLAVLQHRWAARTRLPRSGGTWDQILERMRTAWEPVRHPHLRLSNTDGLDLDTADTYIEKCCQERIGFIPATDA